MNNNSVNTLLKAVGMNIFVQYYYNFKRLEQTNGSNNDVINCIKENYTLKSKQSRTAKAKRIFKEKLQIEALKTIIASDNKQVEQVKTLAKQILREEQSYNETTI